MNKTLKVALLAALTLTVAACASSAMQVHSLRGSSVSTADNNTLVEKAYVGKKPGQLALIARTFTDQPPLVPHTIENYDISATENACWECHNSDDFKGKKMPMVGKSHLLQTADAGAEPKLNMQRWQCNNCHVPQVDAMPLVGNYFQGNISKQ